MAVVGLILLVGISIAVVSYRTFAGVHVSARDVAWLAGSSKSTPAEVELYSRYLERHRRHRRVGAVLGALFAIAVGIRWYGSISIGFVEASPLADVAFCALAGALIGALSAETYRLTEPASSTIGASLAERDGPPRPDLVRLARGTSMASTLAGLVIAVTGNGPTTLAIAVGGLLLTLLAEATRTAISGRRRPILSDRAHRADTRMRSFAGTSVAFLQLAAAVLVAGWVVSKALRTANDLVEIVRFCAVIGSLVLTVVIVRKASPRPPRR